VKTILFACVHNAGRSQMAAAMFNALADPRAARAVSAGTRPAEHVRPVVVEAMREVGIELGEARPRKLTPELERSVDHLVTMGCGDACPFIPAIRREDWPLADPNDQPLERVRDIRDEIRARVERLIRDHGWTGG
jgi:arsenate reductase (thioredoxin)